MIFLHRLGGIVPKIQHLIHFILGKLMNILTFAGHGWTVKGGSDQCTLHDYAMEPLFRVCVFVASMAGHLDAPAASRLA